MIIRLEVEVDRFEEGGPRCLKDDIIQAVMDTIDGLDVDVEAANGEDTVTHQIVSVSEYVPAAPKSRVAKAK